MKFNKCILHIGTEKTGTTTLQRFLASNRRVLRKNGIYYPSSLGKSEHVGVVCYAMDDYKMNSARIRARVISPRMVPKHRRRINAALAAELADVEDCHTLLVSSERLHSQVVTERELRRLRKLLEPYCKSFEAVIYLRPQHEIAISSYSTRLKNGQIPATIIPVDAGCLPAYHYYKSLVRWSAFCGRMNLHPRIYSRTELRDGDIRADFLDFLKLPAKEFIANSDQNESLNVQAQSFLELINPLLPTFQNKRVNSLRGHLNRHLGKHFTGGGKLPCRDEVVSFFGTFKDENERIRSEFFPDRPVLFHVDFDKYPERPDERKLSSKDILRIFFSMWQHSKLRAVRLLFKLAARAVIARSSSQFRDAHGRRL